MNQKASIGLAVILIISLTSCSRQTECPALSTDDLKHFPYRTDDTLRFANQEASEIILVVNEVRISDAYTYHCHDLNRICGCERYAEALVMEETDTAKFLSIKMLIQSSNLSCRFYYTLLRFAFEFDFENDAPYVYMIPNIHYVGNFTVSDSVFSDVYKVENANFTGTNVEQVFFSKTAGIIRFDEYTSGNVWQLKLEGSKLSR